MLLAGSRLGGSEDHGWVVGHDLEEKTLPAAKKMYIRSGLGGWRRCKWLSSGGGTACMIVLVLLPAFED